MASRPRPGQRCSRRIGSPPARRHPRPPIDVGHGHQVRNWSEGQLAGRQPPSPSAVAFSVPAAVAELLSGRPQSAGAESTGHRPQAAVVDHGDKHTAGGGHRHRCIHFVMPTAPSVTDAVSLNSADRRTACPLSDLDRRWVLAAAAACDGTDHHGVIISAVNQALRTLVLLRLSCNPHLGMPSPHLPTAVVTEL